MRRTHGVDAWTTARCRRERRDNHTSSPRRRSTGHRARVHNRKPRAQGGGRSASGAVRTPVRRDRAAVARAPFVAVHASRGRWPGARLAGPFFTARGCEYRHLVPILIAVLGTYTHVENVKYGITLHIIYYTFYIYFIVYACSRAHSRLETSNYS